MFCCEAAMEIPHDSKHGAFISAFLLEQGFPTCTGDKDNIVALVKVWFFGNWLQDVTGVPDEIVVREARLYKVGVAVLSLPEFTLVLLETFFLPEKMNDSRISGLDQTKPTWKRQKSTVTVMRSCFRWLEGGSIPGLGMTCRPSGLFSSRPWIGGIPRPGKQNTPRGSRATPWKMPGEKSVTHETDHLGSRLSRIYRRSSLI